MLRLKVTTTGIILAIAASILASVTVPGPAWADGPYLEAATSSEVTYSPVETDRDVLVAFESGDVRTPYVVGSLWNGNDRPPGSDSDESEEDKE